MVAFEALAAMNSRLENKLRLCEEDIESTHMYLDDLGAPDKHRGKKLSLVGRIKAVIILQNKVTELKK